MIEQIRQYVKGELTFEEGCSLFLSSGGNRFMYNNFIRGTAATHGGALRYQLQLWLWAQPEELPIEVEETPAQQPDEPAEENVASVRTQLAQARKEYYRERGHYHGQLHAASSNEERYELAKKVITAQAKIDAINREMRVLESGEIPARFLQQTMTAEQFTAIKNCRQYIARYRKQLDEAEVGSAQFEKLKGYIRKYEEKLKLYVG